MVDVKRISVSVLKKWNWRKEFDMVNKYDTSKEIMKNHKICPKWGGEK